MSGHMPPRLFNTLHRPKFRLFLVLRSQIKILTSHSFLPRLSNSIRLHISMSEPCYVNALKNIDAQSLPRCFQSRQNACRRNGARADHRFCAGLVSHPIKSDLTREQSIEYSYHLLSSIQSTSEFDMTSRTRALQRKR